MSGRPQSELIFENELQTKLSRLLGLTQNEARIYCAMFEGISFSPVELSHLTSIHRSRIYDNLRGLEAKKLIEQTSFDPLRYCVVPPKVAMALICEALEDEYKTHIQEILALGQKLDAIHMNRSTHKTSSEIRTCGLDESISTLSELLETAKERVWVSKHTSGGIVDWFVLRTHLNRLLQLGVDIRFLSDRSVRVGYNTRILQKVSLSYALIDKVSVTFFLSKSSEDEGSLMISTNPDYVDFLEDIFLADWDKGQVDTENRFHS
jgi:sugar-specific transcriptional regulator TrmB